MLISTRGVRFILMAIVLLSLAGPCRAQPKAVPSGRFTPNPKLEKFGCDHPLCNQQGGWWKPNPELVGLSRRGGQAVSSNEDVGGVEKGPPVAGGPRGSTSGSRFTVLLTNDDGYDAPGLQAMIEAMRPLGEIFVAAPAENQSGIGHAIDTGRVPILVAERKQPGIAAGYAIESTPATCVRLALTSLLPRRPDLVISGINRGENLGIVVYYSGTLGAAREAALVGVPAIAVSMQGDDRKDYAATAAFMRELVKKLRAEQRIQPGLFLNVNAPAGETKGVRVARLSLLPTGEIYDRRKNPRGRVYFWSGWQPAVDSDPSTDLGAFAQGFITLTPMVLDVTDSRALDGFRVFETKAAAAVGK